MESLSLLYPESSWPSANESEHCVYCHKSFVPRLQEECTVDHETGPLNIEPEGCEEFYTSTECLVCGKEFSGSGLKENEMLDACRYRFLLRRAIPLQQDGRSQGTRLDRSKQER